MKGFEDLSFDWAGKSYKLPANKVLGAIARVEDIITLNELQRYGSRGAAPMAKLSMAYGALLRYAGAQVSDTEMYEAMFGDGKTVESSTIVEAIITLISVMIPPSAREGVKDNAVGKAIAAAVKETAKGGSLKKPSKLRSQSGK